MKILRCVIRRKDNHFNTSSPRGGIRGGRIDLGTSSIVGRERERWVDIEQRAALYSPDPEAAVVRAGGIRTQRGFTTWKEGGPVEEESRVAGEEEYFKLARPPSWFRGRKGCDLKDMETRKAEEGLLIVNSSRESGTVVTIGSFSGEASKESWRSQSLP